MKHVNGGFDIIPREVYKDLATCMTWAPHPFPLLQTLCLPRLELTGMMILHLPQKRVINAGIQFRSHWPYCTACCSAQEEQYRDRLRERPIHPR